MTRIETIVDPPPRTLAEVMAAECGVVNAVPNRRFALRVWKRLVQLGAALPEDDRPGPARGQWQHDALKLLLDHPNASLQGARQGAGKTYVAAIVICCHLLLGGKVAVAMPSLRQGSRILLRRTLAFMRLLEPQFGLKRKLDNSLEAAWDNGAQLFALSTSDAAATGTQGYTCRVVVIDEAHELDFADLGYFTPLVRVAQQRGRGRLLLLGVGGLPGSAIEMVKQNESFTTLTLDDELIAAMDDAERAALPKDDPRRGEMGWRAAFRAEQASTDEDTYRQFFRCQPPLGGTRRIFQLVPGPLPPAVEGHWRPRYFAGIDVGRVRDRTVVCILEQRGETVNLVAVHQLPLGTPYTAQARMLAEILVGTGPALSAVGTTPALSAPEPWQSGALSVGADLASARSGATYTGADKLPPYAHHSSFITQHFPLLPRDIAIEINGAGAGLYDILADRDEPVLSALVPVTMSAELKTLQIGELNRDIRRGRFGVADLPASPVGTGPAASAPRCDTDNAGVVPTAEFSGTSVREHLAALKLDVSPEGRLSWEHSDILSALLVARTAQLLVECL